MKIIKPSFKEMISNNPQKHIESIARTCYKSEDKITEDSHKRLISNLYKNKHWAMLEHFIFIYEVDANTNFYSSFLEILNSEKYISVTMQKIDNYDRYIISFNARSILDMLNKYKNHNNIKLDIIKLVEKVVFDYDCDELFGNRFKKVDYPCFKKIDDITILTTIEQWIHGWHSIKFICDRGVSHEIVRHRDASFAQESTRYCNYSKDKFDNEIMVIEPLMFNSKAELGSVERQKYNFWKEGIEASENAYFYLLDMGATPQEARAVLPNSLKTELIMTARNYEWKHFFELRCDEAAHPQMRELAIPLLINFTNKYPELFKETYSKIKELVI